MAISASCRSVFNVGVHTNFSHSLCHLEGATVAVCWICDLYLVLSISTSLSTVQRSSSAVRHRSADMLIIYIYAANIITYV